MTPALLLSLALAATVTDIDIDQGATWTKAWKTNRVLTGCTLDMEIRDAPGGTLLAAPAYTVTSATRGEFTTTLTALQTATFTQSIAAVYDIEAACAGGLVYRLFEGTARISLEVTTGELPPGSWPEPAPAPADVFLRVTDAASTYLTQANAAATYLSQTTAPLTYYVNASTGSDSNACTSSGAPCLTIQKALDEIPDLVRHAVVVNVAAGTYATKQTSTRTVDVGGSITIQGTLATVTPATGLASGTIASYSTRTATVTGAGWTVNDLRDKFLRTTADGELYPIASNTATTVELAYATGSLAGKAFDIVDQGTIVNGGTAAGDVAFWVNQTGVGEEIFSPLTEANVGLILRNMEIVARTCVRSSARVKLYGTRLKYHQYGVLLEQGQAAQVFRSVLLEQSALGGAGVNSAWSQFLDVAGCYLRGATGGAGVRAEGTNYLDVSSSGNVVEGHTYGYLLYDVFGAEEQYSLLRGNTYGVSLGGKVTLALVSTTITGNTYGIYQSDGGTGSIAIISNSATISSNTSHGVHLDSYASLKMLGATTLTSNGGNAIDVAGAHCSVEAYDTTNISSNVVFAVKAGFLSAFTNIYVASSCTIGSPANGADFTLDNHSSTFTRAACTAAAGNAKIEATKYFNRAFCP